MCGHVAQLKLGFYMITDLIDRRLVLFAPVALGFGAVGYFTLPLELPLIWSTIGGAILCVLIGVIYWLRAYYAMRMALMLLLIAGIGFFWTMAMVHLRMHRQGELPLTYTLKTYTFDSEIVWIERRPHTTMLRIRVHDADGRAAYLRLYSRLPAVRDLHPGCMARMRLRLRKILGPVTYHGFDIRLARFFADEIGQGFIWRIRDIRCPPPRKLETHIARARLKLADIFDTHMSQASGAVASALIVGVRGGIPTRVIALFRDSGLAHMLAISGLHMALFAGALYALLRILCAVLPSLVERYDTRKACASVALISASIYLVMSGASIATQRAFIMIALVFIAIILERPALTRHNVAIAALIVLILRPASVLSASFQMSFAAVLALVSFYEFIRHYDILARLRASSYGWYHRLWQQMSFYFVSLFLTSLVAGFVTGLIALYHFNRFGNFGLFANLLALPILGFIIMPSGLLALLMLPFGLVAFPLMLAEAGINWVLAIADFLVSRPGAVFYIADSPPWVLLMIFVALMVICLGSRWWRLLGMIPLIVALLGLGRGALPDAYILGNARLVGIRDEAGHLRLSSGHGYVAERWRQSEGVALNEAARLLSCAQDACVVLNKYGIRTIYLRDSPTRASIVAACARADVVIVAHDGGRAHEHMNTCFTPDLRELGTERVVALFYMHDDRGRVRIRAVPLGGEGVRWWMR